MDEILHSLKMTLFMVLLFSELSEGFRLQETEACCYSSLMMIRRKQTLTIIH